METIQLTIDESLLAEVQQATKESHDAEGYGKHPQCCEEIEEWESEQNWENNEKTALTEQR